MRPAHPASRGKLGLEMGAAPLQQGRFRVRHRLWAGYLATLSFAALPLAGWAQTKPRPKQTNPAQTRPNPAQTLRPSYDAYILGPGDSLEVELLNIPELSGRFSIGPDGTLVLPRLRALVVEELRYFLTEQFKAYVKSPQLYVRPVG